MDYDQYAKAGLTQAETARACGVSRQAVAAYARKYGVVFVRAKQKGIPHNGFDSRSDAARHEGVTPQAVHMRIVRQSNA